MSWSVYLKDGDVDSIGCTYNLAPMFRAAGLGVRSLNDMPCSEALEPLRLAIKAMEDDPPKFKSLNPPNGWGDYDSGLEFLREVRAMCVEHPADTLVVT